MIHCRSGLLAEHTVPILLERIHTHRIAALVHVLRILDRQHERMAILACLALAAVALRLAVIDEIAVDRLSVMSNLSLCLSGGFGISGVKVLDTHWGVLGEQLSCP